MTLVGVGGTGKTRLMLELAAELVDRFADGVWLVELAGITDPQLVVGQIARSVGLENEPGRPTIDTLTDFLRDKTRAGVARQLRAPDRCRGRRLPSSSARPVPA